MDCRTCYKVVLQQDWYSVDIRIMLQPCVVNFVTTLLQQVRIEVVRTTLQTCSQLGTSIANPTCRRLVDTLATGCVIFTCAYYVSKNSCNKSL